jgi:hypothetical protein
MLLRMQIDDDVETHLYLTDYRSLYAGQLGEVTADAVLEEEGEAEHAPSYYRGQAADFWFRLWDLRRLLSAQRRRTRRCASRASSAQEGFQRVRR